MARAQSQLGRRYGWKPSLPTVEAPCFKLGSPVPVPRYINHVGLLPAVWDQGREGSCTAHGGGGAFCHARAKAHQPYMMPSRSFIYYNTRAEEGTASSDAGASVADTVDVMAQFGVPPESLCPYGPALTQRPADSVYTAASAHRVTQAGAISQDLYTLFQALAQGYCVVFGFTVYQSFESDAVATTGMVPMPAGSVLGGHCVLAIGKNSLSQVICRNSWGTGWGDPDFPGHFWMQPAYISNSQLCADFHVVEMVSS